MSFFDAITTIVKIDDKNTITLRALEWGEEQSIQQQSMKVSADQSGNANADVDPVKITRLTFEKAIIAWDGPGFDDRPVTPENIAALPSRIMNMLKEPYNELSGPTDSEKNE